MITFIQGVLLTLLAAITIAIVRQRNLFGVVILAGIYSFLIASVMMVLDAVDVAMTEASVGAGISTVVLLAGSTRHDGLALARCSVVWRGGAHHDVNATGAGI